MPATGSRSRATSGCRGAPTQAGTGRAGCGASRRGDRRNRTAAIASWSKPIPSRRSVTTANAAPATGTATATAASGGIIVRVATQPP